MFWRQKMNRMDRRIAERLAKGKLPTAFVPWDEKDVEICPTVTTASGKDYTKMGIIIFEYE